LVIWRLVFLNIFELKSQNGHQPDYNSNPSPDISPPPGIPTNAQAHTEPPRQPPHDKAWPLGTVWVWPRGRRGDSRGCLGVRVGSRRWGLSGRGLASRRRGQCPRIGLLLGWLVGLAWIGVSVGFATGGWWIRLVGSIPVGRE